MTFAGEDVQQVALAFLDRAVKIEEDGNLDVAVRGTPTRTARWNGTRLSSKPYDAGPKTCPARPEGQGNNRDILNRRSKRGYPNWAFANASEKPDPGKDERRKKRHGGDFPYPSLGRILRKRDGPVRSEPSRALGQKPVRPKDETPGRKRRPLRRTVPRQGR